MLSITKQDDDEPYEHVLDSSKPDKEIEYFWLTFKVSIRNHVDKYEQKKISYISSKLNELQKKEQYDQIEIFISKYLHDICFSVLITKNYTEISHLKTNIKRWENISKHQIFDKSDIVGIMLNIASSIKTRKNKNKNKILDLIASWCKLNQNKIKKEEELDGYEFIDEIVKISIENLYYGMLDKLSNGVFLFDCVDIDIPEEDQNKYFNLQGKAFIKFYKKYINNKNK